MYYGRCANGRYRLDFMKISRWDFGMCICVLYSIQCNRPSDQCKSKRLSTTSEFERFYKESRYWLISVAAVFVSSPKGRESWVTSGGPRGGAGGPPPLHPLIFRPNWGPKGRKNSFGRMPPHPPYLRVWMTAPHISQVVGDETKVAARETSHRLVVQDC